MNNKNYKTNVFNRLVLLCFDIETYLDSSLLDNDTHIVDKLFFFVSRNYIKGKLARPYLIKFIYHTTSNENDKKSINWSISDILSYLQYIPLYELKGTIKFTYGYLANDDKIYSLDGQLQTIKQLQTFEQQAYIFDSNNGDAGLNSESIDKLIELLDIHEIDFKQTSTSIELPNLIISLNGLINTSFSNVIIPDKNIKIYSDSVYSIGVFKIHNNRPVKLPDDEHLAIIRKCKHCNKNYITDYMNFKPVCLFCGFENQT